MKHLNEHDLILYYYREGGHAERIEAHLAGCGDCRREWNDLSRTLAAVEAPEVPHREPDYGLRVWQQIRPHLETHPPSPRRRWFWGSQPREWMWAGAMATALIAAFLAGRLYYPATPNPPVAVNRSAPAETVRDRVLLVAVGDHLERSQMMLVELTHPPSNGPVDISAQQQRAEELVAANRLYRQTAARANETNVVNVLDELERVLIDIAHQPGTVNHAELDELRQRIESQGIIFKVRVLESKVGSKEKKQEGRPESVPSGNPARSGKTT